MNRTRTYLASLSLVALMAFGGGEARAAAFNLEIGTGAGRAIEKSGMYSDQDLARQAVREGRVLPLSKVLKKVQEEVPGRLLDANLTDISGLPVYLIKLMTRDGNVAIVSADATKGRILSVRHGGN